MSGDWITTSEDETRALGERLAAQLLPRGRCLLFGPMGSGKTVLAQGIARGLGIEPREVQSPTFTLAREHRGGTARMLHLDLYRLDPGELLAAGVDEMLEADAVVVVEWAERLPAAWRAGARAFRLERLDSGHHRILETAC